MRPRDGRMGETGFTLLELVAAVGMMLVLVAGALGTIRAAMTAERGQTQQAREQAALRRAARQLVLDLQLARSGSAVCGDGAAGEHRELTAESGTESATIRYRFADGTLWRDNEPLVHHLSDAGFACTDGRVVEILLEAPPHRPGGMNRQLQVAVALRSPPG